MLDHLQGYQNSAIQRLVSMVVHGVSHRSDSRQLHNEASITVIPVHIIGEKT